MVGGWESDVSVRESECLFSFWDELFELLFDKCERKNKTFSKIKIKKKLWRIIIITVGETVRFSIKGYIRFVFPSRVHRIHWNPHNSAVDSQMRKSPGKRWQLNLPKTRSREKRVKFFRRHKASRSLKPFVIFPSDSLSLDRQTKPTRFRREKS